MGGGMVAAVQPPPPCSPVTGAKCRSVQKFWTPQTWPNMPLCLASFGIFLEQNQPVMHSKKPHSHLIVQCRRKLFFPVGEPSPRHTPTQFLPPCSFALFWPRISSNTFPADWTLKIDLTWDVPRGQAQGGGRDFVCCSFFLSNSHFPRYGILPCLLHSFRPGQQCLPKGSI